MIVQMQYTVQPGIKGSNPDEHIIKLGKGTLSNVSVTPAPGPNWEVYVRFLHLEDAIIPNAPNEWIPLERIKLDFQPMFANWLDIYIIKVQLCSPQARYPHTIQVSVTLQEHSTTEQLLSSFIQEGY